MLADKRIKDFLEETSSSTPLAPSGGSVLALCAALAAALTELTANLTIGKPKYENVEEEMKATVKIASDYKNQFVKYMDDDADTYSDLISAYKLPQSSDKEVLKRKGEIENHSKIATLVPLKLAEDTLQLLDLIQTVSQKVNKNALGDIQAAAMLANSVMQASLNNIKINLSLLDDHEFSKEVLRKVQSLEDKFINITI